MHRQGTKASSLWRYSVAANYKRNRANKQQVQKLTNIQYRSFIQIFPVLECFSALQCLPVCVVCVFVLQTEEAL